MPILESSSTLSPLVCWGTLALPRPPLPLLSLCTTAPCGPLLSWAPQKQCRTHPSSRAWNQLRPSSSIILSAYTLVLSWHHSLTITLTVCTIRCWSTSVDALDGDGCGWDFPLSFASPPSLACSVFPFLLVLPPAGCGFFSLPPLWRPWAPN